MLDLLEHRIGHAAVERVPASRSSGSRFASAAAAAVTMFVAPGPDRGRRHHICRRRIAFASRPPRAPCPARSAPGAGAPPAPVERVPRARHVPVPEDGEDPGEERRLVAVDDRRCATRKRTIACAAVSLTVSTSSLPCPSSGRAGRSPAGPRVADPSGGGVDERERLPAPACHHVEVVHWVPGGGREMARDTPVARGRRRRPGPSPSRRSRCRGHRCDGTRSPRGRRRRAARPIRK